MKLEPTDEFDQSVEGGKVNRLDVSDNGGLGGVFNCKYIPRGIKLPAKGSKKTSEGGVSYTIYSLVIYEQRILKK